MIISKKLTRKKQGTQKINFQKKVYKHNELRVSISK